MLCGHVPYDDWNLEKINDAILTGIRPYKPKAAAHIGLVDELWDILQRCWDEERESRPDLRVVRACLDEVVPLWHVRKDLPLISADDASSLYTHSHYSVSPSPLSSPAPSSPPP